MRYGGWKEFSKRFDFRLSKAVLGGLGLFITSMETSEVGGVNNFKSLQSHLADSYSLDINKIASLVT